jgi:hypothetical protein
MHARRDVSSFYLANEEIAREIQGLVANGALEGLIDLLKAADLSLCFESRREHEGLRETVGFLGPNTAPASEDARRLPLAPTTETDPLLQSGGPFEPSKTLCARSRFTIVGRDGQAREVYMPDHICPECSQHQGNIIESCERVCCSCGFRW